MALKNKKLLTQYELLNTETGEIIKKTLKEILDDLNRDRSAAWVPYNETDDWSEGLNCFTEYTLLNK